MSGTGTFFYGSVIQPLIRYHYLSPPIPIRPLCCISPLITSIHSNDAVSPQNGTLRFQTEHQQHSEEPLPVPSLSAAEENKATTKLRKKKEDDVVSDNRFKLRNGREVSTLSLFAFRFPSSILSLFGVFRFLKKKRTS